MLVRVVRYSGRIELADASEIERLIKEGEIVAFYRADGWAVIGEAEVRKRDLPIAGVGRRWADIVERCRALLEWAEKKEPPPRPAR